MIFFLSIQWRVEISIPLNIWYLIQFVTHQKINKPFSSYLILTSFGKKIVEIAVNFLFALAVVLKCWFWKINIFSFIHNLYSSFGWHILLTLTCEWISFFLFHSNATKKLIRKKRKSSLNDSCQLIFTPEQSFRASLTMFVAEICQNKVRIKRKSFKSFITHHLDEL